MGDTNLVPWRGEFAQVPSVESFTLQHVLSFQELVAIDNLGVYVLSWKGALRATPPHDFQIVRGSSPVPRHPPFQVVLIC
jgi:hypothetical protein